MSDDDSLVLWGEVMAGHTSNFNFQCIAAAPEPIIAYNRALST